MKDKDTNAIKGKEALEKELKRQGYKVNEILREDWLKSIANKASINTVEDLYASIGYGNIRLNQVITKLKDFYSEYYRTHHEEEFLKEQTKKTQERKKSKGSQGVSIRGIDNIKIRFAKCCNPVPGDEIIGYVTMGRGVSVHRTDCPNVKQSTDPDRFLEVEWNVEKKASYNAEVQVKAIDRSGLLAELALRINDEDVGLVSLNARANRDKIVLVNMILEINDIEQLEGVMNRIRKIKM